MMKFTFARRIFQIFAFAMFIFQIQNSIRKFLTKPIVQQTSTRSFDNIEKPFIYVCQEGQFNYTKAKDIGYRSLTEFTMGKLNESNNYTWNGKFGNISFEDIRAMIFNANYSNIGILTSNTGDIFDYNYAEKEEIYIAPHGFCLNILSDYKITSVTATEKSTFHLVNPTGANKLRMFDKENKKIEFGPTQNGFFEGLLYEVEVNLYDHNIYDGSSCVNYERLGSSYDDCIDRAFKKQLLDWYTCLPPWFEFNSTSTCEIGKIITISDEKLEMYNQFAKFISGMEVDVLESCKPPCEAMSFKLYEVDQYSNRLGNAHVQMRIKDEVTVYTYAEAFDEFGLIVDLGSALGLWLGLSALSIFDTLIDFYSSSKKKYYH